MNGLTPLYHSILHKADLKVTQLLLSFSNQEQQQIHYKVSSGLFRSQMSNFDSSNESNNNNYNSDGADSSSSIGVTDQQGWQEVHQACKLGLDAHLDKLLYYGCDINAKISGSGNTPLHVAAINDQINCAKVLLLRGSDKTLTNNSHQTAYQMAVISNNMDLAEFIAEHNGSKVVSFKERPPNYVDMSENRSQHKATLQTNSSSLARGSSSGLVSLQSTMSLQTSETLKNYHSFPTPPPNVGIVQPQTSNLIGDHTLGRNQMMMNPLVLDVNGSNNNHQHPATSNSSGTTTSSSGQTEQTSLLSIGSASQLMSGNHQLLKVQTNNISPCLSQRSCATSNTTSSSGVCCDGDGTSHLNEDIHHHNHLNQAQPSTKPSNSQSNCHSNITVISISNNHSHDNSANSSNNNTLNRRPDGCGQANSADEMNHEITGGKMISATGAPNPISNNSSGSARASSKRGGEYGDGDDENAAFDDYDEDQEDLKSSGSGSSNGSSTIGLCSLISEERPLYAGTLAEATSEYQSGDPSHLQLHRGDLIEVLECKAELLQAGQLPRLANKPMIYGRRISDGQCGLFPSFCAQRKAKSHHRQSLRQRLAMAEQSNQLHSHNYQSNQTYHQQTTIAVAQNIRGTNLPESQSMVVIDGNNDVHLNNGSSTKWYPTSTFGPSKPVDLHHQQPQSILSSSASQAAVSAMPKLQFKELQVRLRKTNDGFGFVLRGARINPATLAAPDNGGSQQQTPTPEDATKQSTSTPVVIDERLMAANNLASLQYLDEIELDSVAHQAGLKRGDFLVAVNQRDVRLCSHEQVVQMIRQSGNEVLLTIAMPTTCSTPLIQSQQSTTTPSSTLATVNNTSRPLVAKVKPEPPKRDPNTTLTRNKSHRVASMIIGSSQSMMVSRLNRQQQANGQSSSSECFSPFDANKPLPSAPHGVGEHRPPLLDSPTGSLNAMCRSISTNLSQFHSNQSLASTNNNSGYDCAPDTQSISSLSAAGGTNDHYNGSNQHQQIKVSQQATPNHSSSSTTTLNTVATMKPQPPDKPTSIATMTAITSTQQPNQLRSLGCTFNSNGSNTTNQKSAIYQPAVITTTTKRNLQQNLSPLQHQPAVIATSNENALTAIANPGSSAIDTTLVRSQAPPPPPPPPPPPLPPLFSSGNLTSSPTQSNNRLSQRRTSAPINQVAPVAVDVNGLLNGGCLLKKRESLAAVSQIAGRHPPQQQVAASTSVAPVPAQFGEVAAACAAAANSRMQRQRQQQEAAEQQQEQQAPAKQVTKVVVGSNAISKSANFCNQNNQEATTTNGKFVADEMTQRNCLESRVLKDVAAVDCQHSQKTALHKDAIIQQFDSGVKTPVKVPPVVSNSTNSSGVRQQQPVTMQAIDHHRPLKAAQLSATLGRSSAQIIQQPKYQHSQTLKAASSKPKQRPAIPNFDELPPPPPPLPLESQLNSSPEMVLAVSRFVEPFDQLQHQVNPSILSSPSAMNAGATSCQLHNSSHYHHHQQLLLQEVPSNNMPLKHHNHRQHRHRHQQSQLQAQQHHQVHPALNQRQHDSHHHHHHHSHAHNSTATERPIYQQENQQPSLVSGATNLVSVGSHRDHSYQQQHHDHHQRQLDYIATTSQRVELNSTAASMQAAYQKHAPHSHHYHHNHHATHDLRRQQLLHHDELMTSATNSMMAPARQQVQSHDLVVPQHHSVGLHQQQLLQQQLRQQQHQQNLLFQQKVKKQQPMHLCAQHEHPTHHHHVQGGLYGSATMDQPQQQQRSLQSHQLHHQHVHHQHQQMPAMVHQEQQHQQSPAPAKNKLRVH